MNLKLILVLLAVSLALSACGTKQDDAVVEDHEGNVNIESQTPVQAQEDNNSANSRTPIQEGNSSAENETPVQENNVDIESRIPAKEDNVGIKSETLVIESSDKEQPENRPVMPKSISASTEAKLTLEGTVICIDAGHGISSYNKQEAIAPNSGETKPAFASGTRGINQTEEQLNLKVAKKLEKKLRELGAEIHMTRTEANTDMTNIDRAEFANNLNADISVKIHADGSSSSSVHGISMLIPTNEYINNKSLVDESERAGKLILAEVLAQTGAVNRGLIRRLDLTGFNWTRVPIVLIEIGFMTNPDEDRLLEKDEYQNKIVQGIADGLIEYFNN